MSRKLITETAIYGIGAVLPRLINFLLMRVFGGVDGIPTEEFSIYTQLYGFVSIINVLITFGFETTFFRFATKTKDSKKIFNTCFWFIAINALLFFVLVFAFKTPIANWLDYAQNPEYLLWFAAIVLLDALAVIPLALLRLNSKPIKYSLVKVSSAVFQTCLILLFFYGISTETLSDYGLERKVSYPFFANLMASCLAIFLLGKELAKVRFDFDFDLIKPMLAYAYPIMFAGLAFAINENLDKTIMREYLTEAEAGAYGGCYKLAVFMALFVTAFRLGIEPYFFKKSSDTDAKQRYAQILQYFIIVAGAAAILIVANISWLKQLLIPNTDYYIALDIVPIIIIANLFFGVYTNLSVWYKINDITHYGMRISWIGATITILLNFFLMPMFGFMVAAWATLFAYGSMMCVSYFWGRKIYKIPYPRNKILLYMFVTITFVALSYITFKKNVWLGNLLLFLYIAMAFWIEKQSIKLIKNNAKH